VVKRRNTTGRRNELMYNKIRLSRLDPGDCPGCGLNVETSPAHYYNGAKLERIRKEVKLETLQNKPADHMRFFQALAQLGSWTGKSHC
jgi:hypothetical protein